MSESATARVAEESSDRSSPTFAFPSSPPAYGRSTHMTASPLRSFRRLLLCFSLTSRFTTPAARSSGICFRFFPQSFTRNASFGFRRIPAVVFRRTTHESQIISKPEKFPRRAHTRYVPNKRTAVCIFVRTLLLSSSMSTDESKSRPKAFRFLAEIFETRPAVREM